uniref:DUF5681 domain-containing protein n=1 Tax=Desulfovibrio sp. U5L TaxID=596152 RepID=I2PZC6_9BACT
MAENSQQKERKQRGPGKRFEPGQSGNPAGKPKGCRSRATLAAQALIDGQADELVKKAIELALAGDGPVLRAMLDRLCPAKRDSPVSVNLPRITSATDIPAVTNAVLEAVTKGQLTPSEAQAVAGLIETHRKAIETAELSERIAKLEERNGL